MEKTEKDEFMNNQDKPSEEKKPNTIMCACGYPLKNYPIDESAATEPRSEQSDDKPKEKEPAKKAAKIKKDEPAQKKTAKNPLRVGPIFIVTCIIAIVALLVFIVWPLLSSDSVSLDTYRKIIPGTTTLEEVQALCKTEQANSANYSVSTIPSDGIWFASAKLISNGAPARLIGVVSEDSVVQEVVYIDEAARQSGTATRQVDESLISEGATYEQVLALVQMPVVVASAYGGEWAYCYGWDTEAATFACLAVFDENGSLTHFENNDTLTQDGAADSSPEPSASLLPAAS
jgi:hypothetical protein